MRLAIFLLITAGTLSWAPAHAAALGLGGRQKQAQKEAEPREPFCFLHGEALRNPQEANGSPNLGNIIRLRFAAPDAGECVIQFEFYCRKEIVGKGHSVKRLSGFFQDRKGRLEYVLANDCSVKKAPAEGETPVPADTPSQ